MVNGEAGKGSARRPRQISRALNDLQWKYVYTDMTYVEYKRKKNKIKAKK